MNDPAAKRVASRCAIYTRKSSEEGLDQAFNSLDAQRESCAAYILSQSGEGWRPLPHLYDDGGFSGGNMERPALKRLLADIDRGLIDIVVVYKVDRLTRSLGDFGRIVERFDGKGVSFVSVTQAFNTTTSMGRLTLNVLLSFAQFEREVTGERIRDKIAASKAKGLWMGGNVPLGYDPDGRTLKINAQDAELVRDMYQRYLDLGSVHRLRDDLEARGVRSRVRVSAAGKSRGGVTMNRGALFHLLSNRVYLGEVPHKGVFHPGQHPPLLDAALFDEVQAKLLVNAGSKRRTVAGLEPLAPAAPLAGLLTNDEGWVMSPVTARGTAGQLYRYYVSSSAQAGRSGGATQRIPAKPLEQLILRRSQQLGGRFGEAEPWVGLRAAIVGIVLRPRHVAISYRRSHLLNLEDPLARTAGDALAFESEIVVLTIPAVLRRSGGSRLLSAPDGRAAISKVEQDPILIKALARAESWRRSLVGGEFATATSLAVSEGFAPSYVQRLLRLAFLAPQLKLAILGGRQSPALTLEALMRRDLPLSWKDQRVKLD